MFGGPAVIVLPQMSDAAAGGWAVLLDISESIPVGWTLIGGQMVILHCAEHRWVKDAMQFDVLIPNGVGDRILRG